jgi:hypothetical protein
MECTIRLILLITTLITVKNSCLASWTTPQPRQIRVPYHPRSNSGAWIPMLTQAPASWAVPIATQTRRLFHRPPTTAMWRSTIYVRLANLPYLVNRSNSGRVQNEKYTQIAELWEPPSKSIAIATAAAEQPKVRYSVESGQKSAETTSEVGQVGQQWLQLNQSGGQDNSRKLDRDHTHPSSSSRGPNEAANNVKLI